MCMQTAERPLEVLEKEKLNYQMGHEISPNVLRAKNLEVE